MSFCHDQYRDAALIEVAKDRLILRRSLNYDATDPIQGEEYGAEWNLSLSTAVERMEELGFWGTWCAINGKVSGGITLYDGMSEDEAESFIKGEGVAPAMFVPERDMLPVICSLDDGRYVIIPISEK